jgi:hypothetical protein
MRGHDAASVAACRAAARTFGVKARTPFAVAEPSVVDGCAVFGGADAGVALNRRPGKDAAAPGQFVLCQRAADAACFRPGDACLPGHPNYTFTTTGACHGDCRKAECAAGDRCCAATDSCVPTGQKCPLAAKLEDEASGLAKSIAAATSSVRSLTKSVESTKITSLYPSHDRVHA